MKNVYCSLFGHDYEVSKVVTYHVKEYKCKNCKSEMTINGNGNFIPLTPKFKEINSVELSTGVPIHIIYQDSQFLIKK